MSLFELLRDRQSLCRSLVDLTRLQQQSVEHQDYDGLLSTLQEKEQLLARLLEMNRQIAAKGTSALPADQRKLTTALSAEVEAILADVLQTHNASYEQLLEQRQATQAELAQMNDASRVHAAYRDTLAPVTHRALDVGR